MPSLTNKGKMIFDFSDINIKYLNNGLSCYSIAHRDMTDSMALCLMIKAGSADEEKGEKGWVRFLERLSVYPTFHSDRKLGKGCFRAFDYACTSFSYTAFFFRTMDSAEELLRNSISSAKGILDGIFLNESAFNETKEVVLREYGLLREKPWYSLYVRALNDKGITLPIGIHEDILAAELEKLSDRHCRWYRPENAALFIYSPYSAQEVKNMTEQIFQSQETGQRKVSADFGVKDFNNSESMDVSKFMKVCREHFLGLSDKSE